MDIITKKLRELRISNGYTIESLANKLNLPVPTYHHYERGSRKLPCEVLIAICKFYGVSADYVLGLSEFE